MRNRRLVYLILITALLQTTCAKSEKQKLGEAAARGDYSYKQYKTKDYATAKAALLDFIEFLKGLLASPTVESQAYNGDIMISYVRLAKLEETHGGTDKDKYMAQAAYYCEQVKFKKPDCSYATLRKAIDLLDTAPVK